MNKTFCNIGTIPERLFILLIFIIPFKITSAQRLVYTIEGGIQYRQIGNVNNRRLVELHLDDTPQAFYSAIGYEHLMDKKHQVFISGSISTTYYPGIGFRDLQTTNEFYVTSLYSFRARHVELGITKYGGLFHDRLHWGFGVTLRGVKITRHFEDITDCKYILQNVNSNSREYWECEQVKIYPGIKLEPSIRLYFDVTIAESFHLFLNNSWIFGFSKYADWTWSVKEKDGTLNPTVTGYLNGTGFLQSAGIKIDLLKMKKQLSFKKDE